MRGRLFQCQIYANCNLACPGAIKPQINVETQQTADPGGVEETHHVPCQLESDAGEEAQSDPFQGAESRKFHSHPASGEPI